MKAYFFPFIIVLLAIHSLYAQNSATSSILYGQIIDANTKMPLAFANVGFYHHQTGSISNEEGLFSIPLPANNSKDSLVVQFIGYQTYKQALPINVDSVLRIALHSKTITLQEAKIYANMPDIKSILNDVRANLEKNYKFIDAKSQVFFRQSQTTDIQEFSIGLKKNDIPGIDQSLISKTFDKIPRHSTSFSDLLCNVCVPKQEDDTIKIAPIRYVQLKDIEIDELEKMGNMFNQLLKNTKENEYWKVRTGILSIKMEIDTADNRVSDSSSVNLKNQHMALTNQLRFAHIEDNKHWEFIFNPKRYNYDIAGIDYLNGEEAYIIKFTPKGKGLFEGKMYISAFTFALLRADYTYGKGKKGRDIDLLGVQYSEDKMEVSIMFVPYKGHYRLQYLSKKRAYTSGVHRDISFLKKRKRFLFDKTIYKTKTDLDFKTKVEESSLFLAFDYTSVSPQQYKDFKNQLHTPVIEIEQYHDSLWADYPNIAPEKHLREYKKQGNAVIR